MPSTDETTTGDATTDESASGSAHDHPYTLAIDIGGTGLKANVLDAAGGVVADRVRTPTTYPMPPDQMVEKLKGLADKLPGFDRISAGFPGMVRLGHVLTAPHFVCKAGPGSDLDPKLLKDWTDFDMASALSEAIGKPARVANDADVQGSAEALAGVLPSLNAPTENRKHLSRDEAIGVERDAVLGPERADVHVRVEDHEHEAR